MAVTRIPDYVVIGHIAIDRTPLGDILGGTVLYAALAAARYGARVGILTRANIDGFTVAQREELVAVAEQIEIVSQSSAATTTFTNDDVAGRRSQTLHAWGGEIDLNGLPPLWRSSPALHLAPVAQEIDPRQTQRLAPTFLGCTPQGWMRQWHPDRLGQVRTSALRLPAELVSRIDAMVVSSEESTHARDILHAIGQRGLVAVTRGQQSTALIDRGRETSIPAMRVPVVDATGAGDVFAGCLFASRAARQSVAASARFATAAAALKVAGRGVLSVPRREDVERLIDEREPGSSSTVWDP
ncbi:MAG TPA: PfkB family carbohydrate kinase [Thermomicrobiales bacterium]|nr:PfkB family carbohydrate kinase [Thermomicrobiales bacterium]